jgi:hypothetical protein
MAAGREFFERASKVGSLLSITWLDNAQQKLIPLCDLATSVETVLRRDQKAVISH